MSLRVFSVAGEALHFGARRMETMMRIGWAPVLLLFIAQFVSLFGVLSVMTGELVAAPDLPMLFNGADSGAMFDGRKLAEFSSLLSANAQALFKIVVTGQWGALPLAFWAVVAGSVLVQLLIVSTIVAPMTRLAGLGEEPSPGLLRMKFGEDETRFFLASAGAILVLGAFVLGPLLFALYFTLQSVSEALVAIYAVFPNADSLHTVVERSGRDLIEEKGLLPQYLLGAPLAALAPVFLLFWATMFLHFRPLKGTPARAKSNAVVLAIQTLLAAAAIFLLAWQWALFTHRVSLTGADGRLNEIAPFFGFEAAAIAFLYYLSLRFFPVAGVAVCRRSFRSGGFLAATHSWNILRLIGILILLSAVLIFMQVIIQLVTLNATIAVAAQAIAMVGTFVGWDPQLRPTDWVSPVAAWTWLIVKILYNVFWVFFAYGVLSGVFGRLYRETTGDPVGPTIWSKRG